VIKLCAIPDLGAGAWGGAGRGACAWTDSAASNRKNVAARNDFNLTINSLFGSARQRRRAHLPCFYS